LPRCWEADLALGAAPTHRWERPGIGERLFISQRRVAYRRRSANSHVPPDFVNASRYRIAASMSDLDSPSNDTWWARQ
jgi:hypothetical protein